MQTMTTENATETLAPVFNETPLGGHTSEETAYLVADYPYSFRLRTQIRYWLEFTPKKGWRFVSQTLNPKTGRWNAAKKSTYTSVAASMYLDEKGHVQWTGLSGYSGPAEVRGFMARFPEADHRGIKVLAAVLIRNNNQFLSGQAYTTINGVRMEESEGQRASRTKANEEWKALLAQLP